MPPRPRPLAASSLLAALLAAAPAAAQQPAMLADVYPGGESFAPTWLTPFAGQVFFWANDTVHGWELWRTDGTPAGTALAFDLVPGPGGAPPHGAGQVAVAGGRL